MVWLKDKSRPHHRYSSAFKFVNFSLSLTWFSVTRPACPEGWVIREKSCFLIINIPTLKWSDAWRTCQNLGGDLAIIRTTEENNFIFGLVKNQKTITYLGVWLGFIRKFDKNGSTGLTTLHWRATILLGEAGNRMVQIASTAATCLARESDRESGMTYRAPWRKPDLRTPPQVFSARKNSNELKRVLFALLLLRVNIKIKHCTLLG